MENWAVKLSVLAAIILLTWLASYLASRVVKKIMSDENGLIPSGTIFVNIVRTGIWVIGGSIALSTCFNVDVNAIIATLGVGGIALTLGFQDALSNIFGGLVITLGKSVKTGDWVEVLGQRGKIEDINWRETILVDVDGKQHLIPNSLMNKNSLIHLGEEGEIKITVALPTDTDLETLTRVETLDDEEHVMEIARMLSGKGLQQAAIENAKSLIKHNKKQK